MSVEEVSVYLALVGFVTMLVAVSGIWVSLTALLRKRGRDD